MVPAPAPKSPSTLPSGSVKLAIRPPPPTSHGGLLDSFAAGGIMAPPTGGAKVERSIRTRGAVAEQRATQGTPGIARRAPASVTPRSTTPNTDGRRRDRHDHGDPQGGPREFGRASRAGQAERGAYGGVGEPAYGGGPPKRTATSRPLTARIDGPYPGGATLPAAFAKIEKQQLAHARFRVR